MRHIEKYIANNQSILYTGPNLGVPKEGMYGYKKD
jgi:hypothetical protein